MASDQWYDVELRHLTALEAVAREGSFRKAAESLGFVQSAVSQQIATLERSVGKRLVERSRGPGSVKLTEAGELMLGHAQAIRARLHAAQADLGALDAGELGALNVGITQSVGVRILPQLMQRWSPSWPNVAVRPTEATSDLDLYRLVESGDLDLAFVELPVPEGPFEAAELLVDPYVLVVAADSPLARKKGVPTLKEIGALPLIAHSQCRGLRRVEAQLRARGAEPNVVFRSDVNATVQALVGAGIGAAIVPGLAADPRDTLTVSKPLSGIPPRTLAMVWHRDRRLAPPGRAFVEVAEQVCSDVAGDPERVARIA
jgi:molybdate transport repressor ModE-like protein